MLAPPLDRPGQKLRDMWSAGTVLLPGAFNALSALAAYKQGAGAIYLSGGAITNALTGLPDIGLITLEEMSQTAARACQVAPVPMICDADTGFGGVWNVARTLIEMERAGLAGIHLEDQVSPKRCGHLDGKSVISSQEMQQKIKAAVEHKKDPSFVLIARTDAAAIEGIEGAVDRAKAYVDAGADAIFPEGLTSIEQFEIFRNELAGVPLLANMTEFGKTPLITHQEFASLGYQMVIFPVTSLRVMLKAIEEFYHDLLRDGTQKGWIERMRTRNELYDTLDYSEFNDKDAKWSTDNDS